MTNNVQNAVRDCLQRLRSGAEPERRQAASELARLGISERGSIRTRGTFAQPATDRLPAPTDLATLAAALGDATPDTRCQAALALGEWGGGTAVARLQAVLETDPDPTVRLHAVAALRTIGGPEAVRVLAGAISDATPPIQDAIVSAIDQVITGGKVEDNEAVGAAVGRMAQGNAARVRGAASGRGAVRTRGAVSGPRAVDPRPQVRAALEGVLTNANVSAFLRHRTTEVLDALG